METILACTLLMMLISIFGSITIFTLNLSYREKEASQVEIMADTLANRVDEILRDAQYVKVENNADGTLKYLEYYSPKYPKYYEPLLDAVGNPTDTYSTVPTYAKLHVPGGTGDEEQFGKLCIGYSGKDYPVGYLLLPDDSYEHMTARLSVVSDVPGDGRIVYSASGDGAAAVNGGTANMKAEPIGVYHVPADEENAIADLVREMLLGESGMLNAVEPGEIEIDLDLTLRYILQVRYRNSYMAAASIYNEDNVVVPDSADVVTEPLKMSVKADNGEELKTLVTSDSLKSYAGSLAKNQFSLSMTLFGETSGASREVAFSADTDWFEVTLGADGAYSAALTLDSLKSGLSFETLLNTQLKKEGEAGHPRREHFRHLPALL